MFRRSKQKPFPYHYQQPKSDLDAIIRFGDIRGPVQNRRRGAARRFDSLSPTSRFFKTLECSGM